MSSSDTAEHDKYNEVFRVKNNNVSVLDITLIHCSFTLSYSSVGNTALTYACCGGFEDVVTILLTQGADVEHQNDNGHTPLMEAASCGHVGQ